MRYQFFNIKTARSKFLFLIAMVIFGYILASLTGMAIIKLLGITDVMSKIVSPDLTDVTVIQVQRIFQIAFQLGLFIFAPLLFFILVEQHSFRKLGLDCNPFTVNYLLIIALMLIAIPGINYTHTLNQALHLPTWLSGAEKWMFEKEQAASKLTDAFLGLKSPSDLIWNIIMFGLLPAIGEELFFRGALFSILREWTKRTNLTIFITAFLFSAIHLQFYGFLPRFLLGLGLGYLFYFTGSLWAPMLAHFVNNTLAVVFAYLFSTGRSSVNYSELGSVDNVAICVTSIILTVVLFKVIERRNWSYK
ncbi:MAG: CPBP family intramembrane metalloprotease [Bacteroidetes bacterium]|nr:CPBP family intramembrane metalloprotease [Bacteroidota bacterium]